MACEKRVRFGKTALRCKECKSFCHVECTNIVPLPCIPIVNTPNHKKATGTVSDYTPTMPPMVPSLVVYCTKEVEQRGLQELGVYRIPGSEKEVKGEFFYFVMLKFSSYFLYLQYDICNFDLKTSRGAILSG